MVLSVSVSHVITKGPECISPPLVVFSPALMKMEMENEDAGIPSLMNARDQRGRCADRPIEEAGLPTSPKWTNQRPHIEKHFITSSSTLQRLIVENLKLYHNNHADIILLARYSGYQHTDGLPRPCRRGSAVWSTPRTSRRYFLGRMMK
jgi:hypothetical protein